MASKSFRCQLRPHAKKDEAELLIYDEIGASFWGDGVTAKQVVKDLADVKASKLRVRINSGGGDVFDGLAIYNALRSLEDVEVTTEIDGVAASIASIIALAGSKVKMADNAFYMIHNARGLEYGTADDMREMADLLDKVGGSLVNIYVEHSGRDAETVQAWMDAETWFTAEEAKEAGFVTAITKGKEIKACADLSAFANTPAALKARTETEGSAEGNAATVTVTPPTAAGGAAPDSETAPNTPAAEAKGATPMSDQDKATLLATERARVKAIRAIGQEHNIDPTLVAEWIDDGKTVEEVNALVLAQIKAKAEKSPKVNARVGAPRADKDPARGFGSHVEFFKAVLENRAASTRDGVKDERLKPLAVHNEEEGATGLAFLMPRAWNPKSIRAAAGSDEQGMYSDTYGGFAVPESTLPGLLSVGFEGDPTAGRTTMVPMATPSVKIVARTDKNHTTSVSGGFTVSRRPETTAFTSSRAKIERVTLEATSLVGLAYESEELLQFSAISFAALIDAGFRDQFAAHILNEKIRGSGAGEYEGILNSAAKVSVAKESGQAADTINYLNVLKMRARCWGYGNAIWLANHDALPQLAQMSLAVGTGGAPVYVPGSFGDRPDTLLGRPIFYSEYPSTVGDEGDLILWNPTQYLEGVLQPLQSAESVHVRFVEHERVFKLWLMNAGACWWRSALTPAKGANTLSPIVTLAAR